MSDSTRPGELLVDHVRAVVERAQREYAQGRGQQPSASGAATIATLRRLDPSRVGDDPAGWGLVLDGMPASLQGGERDGQVEPSRAEVAAHAAICLYAVHQQSHTDPVHRRGLRPGRAFGELARARSTGEELVSASVTAHVHAASSASTDARRNYELRTLVTLLRTAFDPTIALDYGLLAHDLYGLSHPRSAPRVRLAWGRDLHYRAPATSTPTEPTSTHSSTTGDS